MLAMQLLGIAKWYVNIILPSKTYDHELSAALLIVLNPQTQFCPSALLNSELLVANESRTLSSKLES